MCGRPMTEQVLAKRSGWFAQLNGVHPDMIYEVFSPSSCMTCEICNVGCCLCFALVSALHIQKLAVSWHCQASNFCSVKFSIFTLNNEYIRFGQQCLLIGMQAFRLQLALEAGQFGSSGPCILDQRLHAKPHHQPILFVDDTQAPNLQLPAKPTSHLPSHGQIAASHAAAAGASYPGSDESDQEDPPGTAQGVPRGVGRPAGKPSSSYDEAESISSSPRATPLRLMQQLMSHGRGLSHTSKHAGTGHEAESPSEAVLLRQASSNSSASSSSHMRVAGPSHGSDSRFAAMKSLTRSAISPRHATSLDSPANLAATRHRCTLAHHHQASQIPGTHAQSPAGCNFDLDVSSLSPASSFGGSAASSFTGGHQQRPRASLTHLVSAPVAGSFADALAAAASFGDSALSPASAASPTAPLLAAAALDSSAAEGGDDLSAVAATTACGSGANDTSCVQTASHSMTDSTVVQAVGKAQHVLHTPQGTSRDALQGTSQDAPQGSSQEAPHQSSANTRHAGAAVVDVPVALPDGASKQLEQLPLSQDSLEFSLDSAFTPAMAAEEEASGSQQLLLQSTGHTSTSSPGDEQAWLQHPDGPSASLLEDRQAMPQDALTSSLVIDRPQQQPLQQLGHCAASLQSSQLLDQHDPGSSSDQQDQQLPHHLMPAVSSASQNPEQSADQLEQQVLLQLNETPSPLSQGEMQPLLSLLDPEPLRAVGLLSTGNGDGADPPTLPVPSGNADGTSLPPVLPITRGNADDGTVPSLLPITAGNAEGTNLPLLPITASNAEGANPPSLPVTTGSPDAHKSGGGPGERQQVHCQLAYAALCMPACCATERRH